jgi:hypothetical protein
LDFYNGLNKIISKNLKNTLVSPVVKAAEVQGGSIVLLAVLSAGLAAAIVAIVIVVDNDDADLLHGQPDGDLLAGPLAVFLAAVDQWDHVLHVHGPGGPGEVGSDLTVLDLILTLPGSTLRWALAPGFGFFVSQ